MAMHISDLIDDIEEHKVRVARTIHTFGIGHEQQSLIKLGSGDYVVRGLFGDVEVPRSIGQEFERVLFGRVS